MTDIAIIGGLPEGAEVNLEWAPNEVLTTHTNGMRFRALGDVIDGSKEFDVTIKIDKESGREVLEEYICFSVGGGSLVDDESVGGPPGSSRAAIYDVYHMYTMNEMLEWCEENGEPLSAIVWKHEGDEMKKHLEECWDAMMESVERGLTTTGALPGKSQLSPFLFPLPNHQIAPFSLFPSLRYPKLPSESLRHLPKSSIPTTTI